MLPSHPSIFTQIIQNKTLKTKISKTSLNNIDSTNVLYPQLKPEIKVRIKQTEKPVVVNSNVVKISKMKRRFPSKQAL